MATVKAGLFIASMISDFDEAVDDRVAILSVAGEGINITYDDGAGTLTIDGEDATDSNKGIASFDLNHFTVVTGAVSIASAGIDDTLIDWGTGAGQVSAVDVPIADVGSYYIGAEVETALAELGKVREFFNGTFDETFTALITSDGDTITLSLQKSGGGDLTMNFSDGKTALDCTDPVCTIELTAGTDSSPQVNYIYIPESTKVLTKSTSNWPVTEHIRVAFALAPSATHVQGEGVYINQNWNDAKEGTNSQGHATHLGQRSRLFGAKYFSGIAPNGTDDSASSSYFDYVSGTEAYFKSTAGVVYQMHDHTVSAKDSRADEVYVVNWNGDSYHVVNDVTDITADSTGSTLTNKYFNLTWWQVVNESGEYSPIMCNLPTGSYNTQSSAEGDVDGHDVLTMPREFNLDSSTGFLIARMTFRNTSGNWSHKSTVDLRGQTPSTATGGASGVSTNFADNQFTVFNVTDITKIIDFSAASITTGNTRTITMADGDVDLGWLDQDVTSGSTPTFTATNITGVPAASILAGTFGTGAYVFDNTVSGITTLTADIVRVGDADDTTTPSEYVGVGASQDGKFYSLAAGTVYLDACTSDADFYLRANDGGVMKDFIVIDASEGLLTMGLVGDIILGDSTERDIYSQTDRKINLGKPGNAFNDAYINGTVVMMSNLPLADPSNAGQLWNLLGTLMVSGG